MSSIWKTKKTFQWFPSPPSHRAKNRRKTSLTNFFKFHRGSLIINTSHKPSQNSPAQKISAVTPSSIPPSHLQDTLHRKVFFPDTKAEWNSIPSEVAHSPTLEDIVPNPTPHLLPLLHPKSLTYPDLFFIFNMLWTVKVKALWMPDQWHGIVLTL